MFKQKSDANGASPKQSQEADERSNEYGPRRIDKLHAAFARRNSDSAQRTIHFVDFSRLAIYIRAPTRIVDFAQDQKSWR